jgi:hypothetical protein
MRPPSVTLRVNPDLIAEVRELAGRGGLTEALNSAMQLWITSQRSTRSIQPEPPQPVPAAPATPSPADRTVVPPRPWNAYRPPGSLPS